MKVVPNILNDALQDAQLPGRSQGLGPLGVEVELFFRVLWVRLSGVMLWHVQ